MATLNPTRVAYTADTDSSKDQPVWDASPLWINKNGHMALLKFTTSINSMLGTSASTWSELKFSDAKMQVVVNSVFSSVASSSSSALSISSINSTYWFDIAAGVNVVAKGYQFASNNLVDYIEKVQISGSNANSGTLTFPLGNFFF